MKLTKEYNNYLMQIAMTLPLLKDQSCEKHLMKGSEILEWETITELDGKPIDPEKDYLYSFPLVVYVDHLKRLQKAWKRKGPDGVSDYLVWIDGIVGRYKKETAANQKSCDVCVKKKTFLQHFRTRKINQLLETIKSIFKKFTNAEMDKENIPA